MNLTKLITVSSKYFELVLISTIALATTGRCGAFSELLSFAAHNNPVLSIQVGEQQSRGLEFDISGEILPGWNIIAGYANTMQ
ncbi:hypothetical protein IQ230_20565 [Gloeocapsopsis crepidinum LEGE 06123]|uniref:Uncharacterized protein n=1 Tax=Gloeocapsopsis crepidinum LEGE 06123 TaxID=588587 RepID=A0ABR9UYU9_9CHRO|nr:hypothetical protein [Gloeocapsopsis crepidinum LEGE 06123]